MNMLYLRFVLLLVMAVGIVGAAIGWGNVASPVLSHQATACDQQFTASRPDSDRPLRALVRDTAPARQHDSERQAPVIALRRILPGMLR